MTADYAALTSDRPHDARFVTERRKDSLRMLTGAVINAVRRADFATLQDIAEDAQFVLGTIQGKRVRLSLNEIVKDLASYYSEELGRASISLDDVSVHNRTGLMSITVQTSSAILFILAFFELKDGDWHLSSATFDLRLMKKRSAMPSRVRQCTTSQV